MKNKEEELMTPKKGKSVYVGNRSFVHGQPIPAKFMGKGGPLEKLSKDMLETYKEKVVEVKSEQKPEIEISE